MQAPRAVTVSVLAAHALAWAAAVGLVFAPVYSGSYAYGSTERRTTLVDHGDPAAVITLLLFPVALTVPAVAAVLLVRKWQWLRQVVLWGSAIVFLGLCLLTGFTIGLFFVPAALALFVTAGLDLAPPENVS